MGQTKVCKGCKQELPLDRFYYKGCGNYYSRCKECEKQRLSKYACNKTRRDSDEGRQPGSACIRGYARGQLHRLYEAAIIKSSPN